MRAVQQVWRTAQSPPPPSRVQVADPPPTPCPVVRTSIKKIDLQQHVVLRFLKDSVQAISHFIIYT